MKEDDVILTEEGKKMARWYAKFLLNDFQGLLRQAHKKIENCGITPTELGLVGSLMYYGFISRHTGKEIIKKWLNETT